MEAEHHFEKSLPYNSLKGCPRGFHKRSAYTAPSGKYVPTRCVRSTTPYTKSSAEFKEEATRKMKNRLERADTRKKNTKCPAGYIARAPYVRRYSTTVRQKGYTVKKASGTTYTVKPKAASFYVPAACIKDRGEEGKGVPEGKGIAPLRKGELTKHGYSVKAPTEERHAALKRAVAEFGDLNVYRKLDAVAKLSVKLAPESSKVFKMDREWLKKTYAPLKAF
jgi:hypothetical protein